MWSKVKEAAGLIFSTRLVVEGKGRTFCKAPMWLTVLVGLSSLHLVLITALLVVAFGMQVRVDRV